MLYLDPKVAVGTIIATPDDRIVLVRRAIEPGHGRWVFPGGYVDRGEVVEAAAVREVKEETGLDVVAERFIGSIDYWFVRPGDGARCHKTVHFYLMSATGGDISLHDREFDEVRWFPVGEALEAMTYRDEAKVVEKGLSMASE